MRVARYIVYGAGGIGASLGAQLQRAGCETLFVARGAQQEALRTKGLDYATPEGRERLAVQVVGHPEEIGFRDGDVVVLAMKTQDSLPAIEALARAAGPELPVLCAQNGVENERLVLRRFRSVVGLAVWIPASFVDPGVVRNYAPHAPIELGRFPAGIDAWTEAVALDLRRAGFAAEARANVLAWKYAKLLTNAVSTLDAVCGSRVGLDDVCAAVKAEGMACYRAAGIETVPAAEYEARVAFAVAAMGEIDGAPRAGGSSTQSLARGLSSIETDYVNGELVLLGRLHGVATPVNEAIVRSANELAAKRRAGPFTPAELRQRIEARG
ncbi:MAG: ketopantoate reductase family protein [Deltaproteobacteria bacterium]|nr:ketopantoate reductase family protein [Deltaproteobacteria bacterium]